MQLLFFVSNVRHTDWPSCTNPGGFSLQKLCSSPLTLSSLGCPQLHKLRDVKIADVAARVQRFLRRWCKTAKVKLVDVCFTSVGLLLGLIFWGHPCLKLLKCQTAADLWPGLNVHIFCISGVAVCLQTRCTLNSFVKCCPVKDDEWRGSENKPPSVQKTVSHTSTLLLCLLNKEPYV